jgi:hypothetical protein
MGKAAVMEALFKYILSLPDHFKILQEQSVLQRRWFGASIRAGLCFVIKKAFYYPKIKK